MSTDVNSASRLEEVPWTPLRPFHARTVTPLALGVRKLACRLLVLHGLYGWSFAFNRRKLSLGFCRYGCRRIEMSIDFVERNSQEEILDTILHEIAHALVGPGHGHDVVWKRKCLEIGAKPHRCGPAEMPEGRWKAQCRSCAMRFHRYRKPKRLRGWYCVRCGPGSGGLVWQHMK
jgi:predicted SprT family Zn-dependent metalloprotease